MTVLDPASVALPESMRFSSVNLSQMDNGNWQINDLAIFRAGTFKDSRGIQRTWEVEHLEQMMFNYRLLKDSGKFPNVPVRSDHSMSVDKVVGYITEMNRDGTFLRAHIELVSPDAKDKIDRGQYRARSSPEVGAYETNDEAIYWPTVMGLAFVDIPAVEGLHSKTKSENVLATFSQTLQDDDKETSVADDNKGSGETQPTAAPPAQPAPTAGEGGQAPAPPPTPSTPPPAPPAGGDQGVNEPSTAPAPTPNAPSTDHARAQVFRVNGREVSDFAAVQAHIDSLEGFAKETVDSGRKAFVQHLADTNRIAATQLESLTALALSLTDAQYDAIRSAYENAPAQSLFGAHGQPTAGEPPTTGGSVAQKAILEEQVAMHKRAGMSQEKLEKTNSWKQLQAINSGTAA